MFPGVHAKSNPDKAAVILDGTDRVLTYAELERRSTQLARLLRDNGLTRGNTVAVLATNDPRFFEVLWACLRSGLYLTPVNTHLAAEEASYIVDDCDAKALIVSGDLGELAASVSAQTEQVVVRLVWDGAVTGFDDYDDALAKTSDVALADQPRGADMLYSSGTTGRPKGVKPPLPDRQVGDPGDMVVGVFGKAYAFGPESVYFSPAPLYHAAPLRFGMVCHSLGGTVITTKRFDAEESLEALARHRVTHSQWVPTHFVRLLRLDPAVRNAFDASHLQFAIHAAAPCPVEVKHQMIEWWGPVLHEYYGSTEANGITMIGPEEWLAKPGSVGRAKLGVPRVCGEDGGELPVGETGLIWFEREIMPFAYHKDPEKTRAAQHPAHPTWSTCGDVGHVDEDGYVFLTDRKAFTIISGGVNIYPQEIEDCLVLHEDVEDVAVVGVPDPEFGESVLAVVQLRGRTEPSLATADRLQAHVRSRLAGYKAPRRVEFVEVLPRTATGKLLKAELKRRYATANG